MRHLSVKQKNLLSKWQDNLRKISGQDLLWWGDLPQEKQDFLESINCFENMVTDVDRFLSDRYMDNNLN